MSGFDHKVLISNLSAQERQTLLAQDDFHGLRHFGLHAGAISFVGALIAVGQNQISVILSFLLMLSQGILICFLFTTLHETVHRTSFKTNALNVWVGRICGFLVFLGPDWFRYFHFAHHRFTHDPENDPELASPKPETFWQYLKYMSGLPETKDRIVTLLRNAFWINEDAYVPARGRSKVMREARVQLALYGGIVVASLLLRSSILFYVWLLPIVLGAPFLRGYLLAEHARCPNVASMLENTRTTLTNRIIRFLAWNMPFHVEHHAYPAVPFHKLPAFHEHIRAHIVHLENGYVAFNKSYVAEALKK